MKQRTKIHTFGRNIISLTDTIHCIELINGPSVLTALVLVV